ncbi:MAG: hypothetical protein LAN84_09845 [Acidobacteriia bacterium]|nr:hypothetical protein [Terriglobia bacterium]
MTVSTQPSPAGNILVLKLRRKNLARFAHTIYQEDLEELLLKRRLAREALKEVEKKEEFISTALRTGACIEEGLHIAELVRVERCRFRMKSCKYFRLSVR